MPLFLDSLPVIVNHIEHTQKSFDKVELYANGQKAGLTENCFKVNQPNDGFLTVVHVGAEKPWWRVHIIGRITTPIVVLIELVVCDIFQLMRVINTLIGGVIDLDPCKLAMGMIDLVSIVVQTAVLPMISFIAFLSPDFASFICRHTTMFCGSADSCFGFDKLSNRFWLAPYTLKYKHEYARRIMSIVSPILLTPVLFVTSLIEGTRFLVLDGRWDVAAMHFITVILSLGIVFVGIYGVFDKETAEKIAEKMWSSQIFVYEGFGDKEDTAAQTPLNPFENTSECLFSLGSLNYFTTDSQEP